MSIFQYFIRGLYPSLFLAFHHAAFQVGSIITTTGFATADFNLWPQVPRTILVLLMFIGACAGSTGGGIKGRTVEQGTLHSVHVFFITYALIFSASVLIIGFDGFDLTTNFTAVAATLNNIGPGLELVGPTQNFALFSPLSKLVLIFNMLAGRLEIFPLLLLFVKGTWKKF